MLDLHIMLVVATFVSFMFTLFILNKFLFSPILKFMDKRNDSIKEDLQKADSNSEDIDNINEKINTILSQAKEEAHNLKTQAKEEALQEQEKILESLNADLEKQYDKFLVSLESNKESIKQQISSSVTSMQENLLKKLSINSK